MSSAQQTRGGAITSNPKDTLASQNPEEKQKWLNNKKKTAENASGPQGNGRVGGHLSAHVKNLF